MRLGAVAFAARRPERLGGGGLLAANVELGGAQRGHQRVERFLVCGLAIFSSSEGSSLAFSGAAAKGSRSAAMTGSGTGSGAFKDRFGAGSGEMASGTGWAIAATASEPRDLDGLVGAAALAGRHLPFEQRDQAAVVALGFVAGFLQIGEQHLDLIHRRQDGDTTSGVAFAPSRRQPIRLSADG